MSVQRLSVSAHSWRNTNGRRVIQAIERAAGWLASNGEYHGVLSNHLAAAAGALQIAGELLGTDRFLKARDRYLGIIYREQHPTEGWLNEYGGADPGYQSHAMFYLADIERRTGNAELFERLTAAANFMAWFSHPDGTMGGEYASRGTKFAFPAGFEMLAPRIPSAASVAMHLRDWIAAGRGISAREMDAWNQVSALEQSAFCDRRGAAAADPPSLPWRVDGARAIFPGAGLVVAAKAGRVLVVGTSTGGALKLWQSSGSLVYEDCGYAAQTADGWSTSQGKSEGRVSSDQVLQLNVESTFLDASRMRA